METTLKIKASYYPANPITDINEWMKMFKVSSAIDKSKELDTRAQEMNSHYDKDKLIKMIRNMK